MHRTPFLKLLLSGTIAVTLACQPDRITSPPVDEIAARVTALGFSAVGMLDYGTYVVVEGDIRLEKAALLGTTEPTGKQAPRRARLQYSTDQTVSQVYVEQITVNLTNINAVSNWASAVRTAIAAYNTTSSAIHLSEASPADITYSTVGSASYIAQASFPYQGSPSGKPGPTITINTQYNTLALNQKQWAMVHELGHTLGLRHDNALTNEGAGVPGANLVPGTNQTDAGSVMSTPLGSHTWPGFSSYDLVALRYLYPLFSVTISGPQNVTRFQSGQYFASATNGASPFTYEWRTRQCSDSNGFSCGTWQSWYSTGSVNYTFTSVSSCGIRRNELGWRVTGGDGRVRTDTYPIFITNPC